jgi:DNA-binding NarL/FixJ family response regulator
MSPGPAHAYPDIIGATRERLGPDVFDALVAEAAVQSWKDALAVALAYAESVTRQVGAVPGPISGASHGVRPLTPRELDVLRLVARGDTNKEIGQTLGLRPKTVMHHTVSIYGKLGLRGRAEAAAWAYRHGLAGEATPA